jgi:hypothetical protein
MSLDVHSVNKERDFTIPWFDIDLLDILLFILPQYDRKTIQQTKKTSSLMVQNQSFYQVLFVNTHELVMNVLGLTLIQKKG